MRAGSVLDRSWSIYAPASATELEALLRELQLDPEDPDEADVIPLAYVQGSSGYAVAHQDAPDSPDGGQHLAEALSRRVAGPIYYVALSEHLPTEVTTFKGGVAGEAVEDLDASVAAGFAPESVPEESEPTRPPVRCLVEGATVAEVTAGLMKLYGWDTLPTDLRVVDGPGGASIEVTGQGHRGLPAELSEVMSAPTFYQPSLDGDGFVIVSRMRNCELEAEWYEDPRRTPSWPGVVKVDEIRGARTARDVLLALGFDPAAYGH